MRSGICGVDETSRVTRIHKSRRYTGWLHSCLYLLQLPPVLPMHARMQHAGVVGVDRRLERRSRCKQQLQDYDPRTQRLRAHRKGSTLSSSTDTGNTSSKLESTLGCSTPKLPTTTFSLPSLSTTIWAPRPGKYDGTVAGSTK